MLILRSQPRAKQPQSMKEIFTCARPDFVRKEEVAFRRDLTTKLPHLDKPELQPGGYAQLSLAARAELNDLIWGRASNRHLADALLFGLTENEISHDANLREFSPQLERFGAEQLFAEPPAEFVSAEPYSGHNPPWPAPYGRPIDPEAILAVLKQHYTTNDQVLEVRYHLSSQASKEPYLRGGLNYLIGEIHSMLLPFGVSLLFWSESEQTILARMPAMTLSEIVAASCFGENAFRVAITSGYTEPWTVNRFHHHRFRTVGVGLHHKEEKYQLGPAFFAYHDLSHMFIVMARLSPSEQTFFAECYEIWRVLLDPRNVDYLELRGRFFNENIDDEHNGDTYRHFMDMEYIEFFISKIIEAFGVSEGKSFRDLFGFQRNLFNPCANLPSAEVLAKRRQVLIKLIAATEALLNEYEGLPAVQRPFDERRLSFVQLRKQLEVAY